MEQNLIGMTLQYGTAPALIILCVLVYQLKQDFQRLMQKYEAMEERIRNIEQEYVKRNECNEDLFAWQESMKELNTKIDSLKEEFFCLKGSLKPFLISYSE